MFSTLLLSAELVQCDCSSVYYPSPAHTADCVTFCISVYMREFCSRFGEDSM